jgi:hypothetical protein
VRCGDRVTCRFVETTDPELGLPVFEPEKTRLKPAVTGVARMLQE